MTKKELKSFKKELAILLEKYNVMIGVDVTGDTHGVSTNTVIYDPVSQKTTIIEEYQSYIWPDSLK
jgi:hypothetical protein